MPHPLVPVPTPETRPWWDALAEHRLDLPRCERCEQVFFPPTAICPRCASTALRWVTASGEATLYSYVIHHRPLKLWRSEGPRSVALVKLAEGPMLVSSVVNCPQTPEALQLDMPLRATFEPFDELTVLCFEPAGEMRS
ncbi:MAG: OB-fold domain-containing protein [Acidimicrobiia bacterium]|nr:OB-fold domain-containing protein [Acidimicrobiia bacterium]